MVSLLNRLRLGDCAGVVTGVVECSGWPGQDTCPRQARGTESGSVRGQRGLCCNNTAPRRARCVLQFIQNTDGPAPCELTGRKVHLKAALLSCSFTPCDAPSSVQFRVCSAELCSVTSSAAGLVAPPSPDPPAVPAPPSPAAPPAPPQLCLLVSRVLREARCQL